MHAASAFREERVAVLQAAMAGAGLATLVTQGAGRLSASHLPLLYDPEPAPLGALHGHLARANPQWRSIDPATGGLAIFLGPDAYVSPGWYATKRQTGRVVPTWNYLAVHASGPVTVFEDAERLRGLVARLTERHEAARPEPWAVTDAPESFIDGMLKGIVGFTLRIERLEGSWKLSQNRPEEDRQGVMAGLGRSDREADREIAAAMAAHDPQR